MGAGLGVFLGEAAEDRPTRRYRAFRVGDNGERATRLFLVFRNHDYLILDYADLESIGNPPGVESNDGIVLQFRGSVRREVRIEGRRLLDAVRQLWRQQAYCLEETPEGWEGSDDDTEALWTRETVITRMAVRKLRRRRRMSRNPST